MDFIKIILHDTSFNFALEIIIRCIIMFILIIIFLRFSGKRGVRQLSVFELAIILSLGSAAGDPMFNDDIPIIQALIVFAVIILLYRFTTYLIMKSDAFETLLEGRPMYIVKDGLLIVEDIKQEKYSLDASHIDLSLSLCEWAKVHASKASIKLSVGLNHSNTIPEFMALGDGIENDMVQGRTFKFPAGSIVVFDKGYIDYQWFAQLTHQKVSFVTRLRPKTVYQVKSSRSVLASKGIIADEWIELSSTHAKKRGAPKLLRRIEFYDVEKKRTFEFLSNNFHLAASTIAAIYKDRWKIELFFKAIKQNLKLKSFLGRSRNAIHTQIWIALIAYLLVSFAQHMAQKEWSVQRLLRIIQVNLFERKLLRSLFMPDKKWRKQEEPQLRLFL